MPSDLLEKIKEQQAAAAANPQAQPDPRIQAAQIRAESDKARVEAQNQGDMAELQTRQQIAQLNHDASMTELQVTREIEMLKLANTQHLSLEEIKAKLADTAMRERGKKELFAAEEHLKLTTGSGL